ncbi:MAG: Hsp33 family molecular chaperone HslO [Deltaproteobacteria bacterium]|nr:Hsp33 family molecular chaperone HslO [Deltaproteobacteria bacterium]MCB9787028.1 Hsp33 family molecular chaperone HslO [Deltaproteobacteria bacterium]
MSADPSDRVLRAITNDGAFRVITLRTTDTVQAAIEAQKVRGHIAVPFGELLTASVLVRETMSPGLRVQLVLQGGAGGALVADARPEGLTRGLVQHPPDDGAITFDDKAIFKAMRVMPNGSLHQGIISAEHEDGLSGVLMHYFQASEQVTSMVAVGAVIEGAHVVAAGGYIVQLLPELTEPPLAVMTERLEDFRSFGAVLRHTGGDPALLMSELLYGFPHALLDDSPVHFGCVCSPERLVGAMATLGRDELSTIVAKGEVLDVACDFCGRQYEVGPEQLRPLLEPPS